MRTRLAAFVVALCAFVLLSSSASAGWSWCAKDPVVALNGAQLQILVSIPQELQTVVNGPVQVDVSVPPGVTSAVVFTDDGFNGYGERVRFITDGNLHRFGDAFSATIRASVPTTGQVIPTQLTIVSDDASAPTVTGTSAGVLTLAVVTGNP